VNKTKIFLSGILLAFICFVFMGINFIPKTASQVDTHANASDENPEITILETGDKLYYELLFVRDGQYPEDIDLVEPLRQNTFIDYTSIDLSGTYLTYVGGLAFFKFDNLQVLDLSNNDLTKIPAQTFYNITSLTTLDISNNEITEFEFGNLGSVQNFYAEFNLLNEIDFSSITNVELGSIGYVNLGQNNFTSIENIVFPPNTEPKYFEFYGNNISDADFDISVYSPHQINFIIQNLRQDIEIDDKTKITIYPSLNSHNYRVKFTETTHLTSQVLGEGEHYLDVGRYKVEIMDGETNLTALSSADIYTGFEFIVVKAAPSIEAYMNGKLIENDTKITSPVTLKFFSGDEDYITEYSINGKQYVVGDEVKLKNRGQYTIQVRSVNGDNVSKTLSVRVEVDAPEHNFGTIFIIILVIAGLGVGVMILRLWLKS